MGLRNAFEEIGLESTLRQILRAVTYARTVNDALRVNVENSIQANFYAGNSTSAVPARVWFDSSAIFMVDEREQQRVQSEMQFQNTRNRWVIT